MIDPGWILHLRSEHLTEFFILLPFLASGIFYISTIAIGYWLRPGGWTFVQLGFLVPFATIINLILKHSFAIIRPHEDLHLVHVESILGFPSGDVQVAIVFWGICYLRWTNKYFRTFSIIIIALIMSSRMYLGVHSLPDVIAGLCFGLITLLWWKLNITQAMVRSWFNGKISSYWGLLIAIFTLYFLTVEEDITSSLFIVSSGALIGYGLSLKNIAKWTYEPGMFSAYHITSIGLSYIMLLIIATVIPTINLNTTTKVVSGVLESGLLIFMIFSVFPYIQKTIARLEHEKNIRNDDL
ncbi:MAG: phosphatase PAP2 family protein [Rickettsiaceae bacterium]|nr:phosphatase PAP2 family protein [Rickettsiaceae bacterium]MDP4832946.1 phosphatase PAP2 family protein [Rickettsiaceae bacterium]MDP5020762.1 phosphatase PAP2 family protein [Rickettsiaceae bacterium]MDP5083485.1 phosphatase PAP2 family protein [Rickettsiaceae bacterium]